MVLTSAVQLRVEGPAWGLRGLRGFQVAGSKLKLYPCGLQNAFSEMGELCIGNRIIVSPFLSPIVVPLYNPLYNPPLGSLDCSSDEGL